MPSPLRKMPVRLRLTVAFVGVMAVVLLATGLFLYLRLASELDATIDQGLRSRAGDVSALIRQADSGLAESGRSPLTDRGESLAQILDRSGRVVDAPPALRTRPLLTAVEARRAARGTLLLEHDSSPVGEGPLRLLATPVRAQDRNLIVVVGAAIEDRRHALRNLVALMLVGGPAALLLASIAGYGVAAGALRPVEAMRRRAAAVQDTRSGERLPVPPTNDEVARLGDTLNEMLDRLKAAFERERSFVADASHELRTPLAILKTELELAMRRGRSAKELEATIASASEETDRLAQLAEDLLVIARSEQGRLPIRHGTVAAQALLEGVAERFSQRAREAGVRITVAVPVQERTLLGDPLRLEQALGNLVDNTLRHGASRVELAIVDRADRIELHVRDDGPGFPASLLPIAFDRFTRGDPARSRGGAGLGLAIVAAIAAAHDGSAHAGNRADGGADVWIELPGTAI